MKNSKNKMFKYFFLNAVKILFVLSLYSQCFGITIEEENYLYRILKDNLSITKIHKIEKLVDKDFDSRVLKLTTPTRIYIAKYVTPYKYSFDEEAKSALFLSKHNLGPKIHFVDNSMRLIIMDYLENKPIDISLRKSDRLYIMLAEVLRSIHKLPIEDWMPKRDIFNIFERNVEMLIDINSKKMDYKTKTAINKIKSIFTAEKEKINLEEKVCHNDLHAQNLIFFDNKFLVIDSIISIGDPYYDLATVAIFWCFTPKAEQILLESYFQRPLTKLEFNKFKTIKKLTQLMYVVKALLDCSNSEIISLNFNSKKTLLEFVQSGNLSLDKDKIEFASILFKEVMK